MFQPILQVTLHCFSTNYMFLPSASAVTTCSNPNFNSHFMFLSKLTQLLRVPVHDSAGNTCSCPNFSSYYMFLLSVSAAITCFSVKLSAAPSCQNFISYHILLFNISASRFSRHYTLFPIFRPKLVAPVQYFTPHYMVLSNISPSTTSSCPIFRPTLHVPVQYFAQHYMFVPYFAPYYTFLSNISPRTTCSCPILHPLLHLPVLICIFLLFIIIIIIIIIYCTWVFTRWQ
jgi:hypothetical protein